MSDQEAREWLEKNYGSFSEWRRSPEDRVNETKAWLIDHEIESELKKRNCSVDELFRQDRELYRRYREATSVKIGKRVAD